jgi:hypothetical protein
VFPSSLGYDLSTDNDARPSNVWNIIGQSCDLAHPEEAADDVAFVRAIHADLSRQLRLDRRRIFASGFSNGGEFVHRLAAEAGDIFAAAASWAGIPAEECAGDPLVRSRNPIPVWNGMGSRDDRYLGSHAELPLDAAGIQSYFQPMFDAAPSRTELVNPRSVPAGTVWSPVLKYAALPGNPAGNPYLFVILDELPHKFPNAWPGETVESRRSQGVTMAALHLQWFVANPRPLRPATRPRLPRRRRPA